MNILLFNKLKYYKLSILGTICSDSRLILVMVAFNFYFSFMIKTCVFPKPGRPKLNSRSDYGHEFQGPSRMQIYLQNSSNNCLLRMFFFLFLSVFGFGSPVKSILIK